MKKFLAKLFLCLAIFIVQTTRSEEVEDRVKRKENREIALQLRGRGTDEAEKFVKIANSFHPVTDKVNKHKYFLMYGRYLVPVAELHKKEGMKTLKFLEIGLGCNMEYVKIWRELLGPTAEIWEAEYNKDCVDKSLAEGKLAGINLLIGDQGNATVVNRWVKESGGNFDVIIDDGGHFNIQIMTSLEILWPQLNPGGFYFIEDIDSQHDYKPEVTTPMLTAADIMQQWIDQLLLTPHYGGKHFRPAFVDNRVGTNTRYPMPHGLEMIACQLSACVLIKGVSPLYSSSG